MKGDNDSCKCEDPLVPQSRGEFRAWAKAQNANAELVKSLIEQGSTTPDIAFLGASIVEEMAGKWFGADMDDNLKSLKKLFDTNFKKSEGAELDAVALGIAGDTVRCTISNMKWKGHDISIVGSYTFVRIQPFCGV